MKVKVCGLREPDNIAAVHGLGIDYLGLIFHPASPRFAGHPSLTEWLAANSDLLDGTTRVGVFVNAEIDYVLNTVHDYGLDWIQLHGTESPGYCEELKLFCSVNTLHKVRLAKAFSINEKFNFSQADAYVTSCPLFVFDNGAGGTGRKYDWSKLDEYTGPVPFLLSGGIGPEDADKVLSVDHPKMAGIDVNSRFETMAGVKDIGLLDDFLSRLRTSGGAAAGAELTN